MLSIRVICLFMLGLLLFPVSKSLAQSISVTPASPSVGLGQTLQFSATVTGLTSTEVTWSSGGVLGGNATSGTISTTGIYTAPSAMPAQNPVQVAATSKTNSTITGSTYVIILSLGPIITSVAPNPLAVGTINVTIQGTGFLPGAVVFFSYGSSGQIAMATTSVTATTVKATGYLGPASSATFMVKNPGSTLSNPLTIPVKSNEPPPNTYSLNVVNGSGGGSYASGASVNITANAPPAGQVFVNWSGAAVQNANSASTSLVMPAANTIVTANYGVPGTVPLTVINGAGGGAYLPGTVVTITANAPLAGQVFTSWTGTVVQNPNAASTTITTSSTSTTVTANYAAAPVNIPYPVTTHPRLWITQQDIPRLQSWATPTNSIYQQGMKTLLAQAVSLYTTQFFPNGVANPNYPDPGDTQGYQGHLTEQVAIIFALNSLIDPSAAARILYAQYARNLLMVAMNQAVLGHKANTPFRDPMFAVYNRANFSGEQWPLIVDWIYNAQDGQGQNILTAADKVTLRNVFLIWANDCINASTTGGDHPSPIGVTNSMQLLPGNKPYRLAANNYYIGHSRLVTMMSLCIDPSDDPLINSNAPASQLGNTLRSFILNATGAWLFQEFAMFGDPSTVASAYGIPGSGAGFGLASGGLPAEGMLYGHSIGYMLGQLLALQTAGFNSTINAGPQSQLINSPVWDRFVTGYISSMVPTAKVDPSQPWLGPIYQYASYGDLLRLWVTPDLMQPFALMALLDQQNNKTTNMNAARWMAVNGVEGGSSALLAHITQPWTWGTENSILYFLLMDPTASAPVDPRPTFPTTFYDPAAGRIMAHSDWTSNNTMFDYRASWISINHQVGDGGQFEFYRNGEWLTKEMSNYDNNDVGLTTVYHNTLALQNWCPNGIPNLNWFESGEWANGSQWMLGLNAGDPITLMSTGPGYVHASSDLTKLFNRPNVWRPASAANNITQATRSIVWLNSDYIVVYDRATSINTGLFKRFNLSLVNNPVIQGNVATQIMGSGQKLFIQTLLPMNPSITSVFAAGNLNPIAQLEPTRFIMTVEDPNRPTDTRFLHVLQGADPLMPMDGATYLQSTSGTPFDGAVFASSAVFFPVSGSGAFAATTFSVPGNVHTILVTGLAPNTSYGFTVQPGGNGSIITVTPGGNTTNTDAAGLLRQTF